MTVSATTSRADYTGNGTTTAFTVPFYFLDNTHLTVLRTQVSTGIVTTLVLNSDYTVTGAGSPSGGTATMSVAPTVDQKLSILRNVPLTQLIHYVPNDPFPAATHEQALDQLTMEVQQLSEQASRALTLSPNTVGGITTLPTATANYLIGWNSAATGLQNVSPTALATIVAFGTANADIFTGDGTTKAFTLTANPGAQANLDVSVGGVTQYPVQDYTWSGGTTLTFISAPPNGVKILARYFQGLPQGYTDSAASTFVQAGAGAISRVMQDKGREIVSALDFGGYTGTAIQTAINAVVATGKPGVVKVPPGTYTCTSGLTINLGLVKLVGDRAVLDFSTAATNVNGITITGGNPYLASNPYKQADSGVVGFEMIGPGQATGSLALYFDSSAEPGPSHINIGPLNVHGWGTGWRMERNAYLIDNWHVDFWQCGTCVTMPSGYANSGSNVNFYGGTLYNSTNGFDLNNPNNVTNLYGVVFGGIGTGTEGGGADMTVRQGQLNIFGGETEGNNKQRTIYVPVGNASLVTINDFGMRMANGAAMTTTPYIDIAGNGNYMKWGGQVICASGTTTAVHAASGCYVKMEGHQEIFNGAVTTFDSGSKYYYEPVGSGLGPTTNLEITGATMSSSSGAFVSKATAVTINASFTTLIAGDSHSYVFSARDRTSGGISTGSYDTSAGVVMGLTGIGTVTFQRTAGVGLQAKTTGGATTRSIAITYTQID